MSGFFYGLKAQDVSGNFAHLTAKIGKILASGTLTMSNSLEGDNTYGEDVTLGDTYDGDEIGVIAYPTKFTFRAQIVSIIWPDGSYPFNWYADSNTTYYTKNPTNGVMSIWSAGAMTLGVENTWDGMGSAFPLASWDYPDAVTTFSSVRIWAAMAHIVYDASAADFKAVYTIGVAGVKEIEYVVFLKGT